MRSHCTTKQCLPATGGPSISGTAANMYMSPNAGVMLFLPATSPVRIAMSTTKQPSCKPKMTQYAIKDPKEVNVGSRVVMTLHTNKHIWNRFSRFTRGMSDIRP